MVVAHLNLQILYPWKMLELTEKVYHVVRESIEVLGMSVTHTNQLS